jgi:hypothetical protein
VTFQEGALFRNDKASQLSTRLGATSVLKLFDSDPPANCAASDGANVLVSISLQNPSFTTTGAVATLAGTPSATASATGYARTFRIYDSAGTPNCQLQGLCSEAWAQSTAYALHQQVHNTNGVYQCTTAGTSNSSGTGPSGTGTGITDGSAVWKYMGAKDLTLATTNIASGGTVTISTPITYTAGNG